MKILALGDVTGVAAIPYLRQRLYAQRTALGADVVIANGENVTDIKGISRAHALELLDCGIDLITTGNHVFSQRDIGDLLDSSPNIIRPANYPPSCPGMGYTTLRVGGWRLLCINVLGVVYMEPLDSPFATVERILEREQGKYDFALLDMHAEATSEKIAMGRYFDGRIHVVFGTHTHVPTADAQILPRGTGYITDLGMTGPVDGILGTDAGAVIRKFTTKMPQRFNIAQGEIKAHGALFDLDTAKGRVVSIKPVTF